eukprot:s3748_g11.t1
MRSLCLSGTRRALGAVCASRATALADLADLAGHGTSLKLHRLERKEQDVILLGALHDQDEAAMQVKGAIESLRPDHVALELCERRFKRLFPFGISAFAQLPAEERRSILQRLRSGKDQFAAAVAAYTQSVPVTLCDRDFRITEDRLLAHLQPDILKAGSLGALGLPSRADLPVEEALEEAVATCIWDERDKVMARRLQTLPGLVLAVVGVKHMEGLAHHLTQEIDPVNVDVLCKPVHLPLWRRVIGQPILWRLRGTFGKDDRCTRMPWAMGDALDAPFAHLVLDQLDQSRNVSQSREVEWTEWTEWTEAASTPQLPGLLGVTQEWVTEEFVDVHDRLTEKRAKSLIMENAEDKKERIRTVLVRRVSLCFPAWCCQRWARSTYFESLTLFVIGVNCFWMAYDTDSNDAITILDAALQFAIMENFFCAYFSFEWAIRFGAFRRKCDSMQD